MLSLIDQIKQGSRMERAFYDDLLVKYPYFFYLEGFVMFIVLLSFLLIGYWMGE